MASKEQKQKHVDDELATAKRMIECATMGATAHVTNRHKIWYISYA
jgi:hypothetical protein